MNTAVNPCEDFYQYSCGGWEKMDSIPAEVDEWGTFQQVSLDNYNHLVNYLSKQPAGDAPEAIKKMNQIFAACVDDDTVEKEAPKALEHFLTLIGRWDETNITEEETWSIDSNIVMEHYYGSDAFFTFDIKPDDHNSSLAVIKVSQSGLSLGVPELYRNESNFYDKALVPAIEGVLLGVVNGDTHQLAVEIADFERELSYSVLTETQLRNLSMLYNSMSLSDFSDLIPQVDRVNYFNGIFNATFGKEQHHVFTKDDIVIVETIEYFRNLSLLLKNANNKAVKDYAKWHAVKNGIQFTDEVTNRYEGFRKSKSPTLSKIDYTREIGCAMLVESSMPLAVARPFAKEFVSDKLKKKVNDTINVIEKAFIERIMEKDWLDTTTKNRCIDKVNAITRQIAYPDFIMENAALNKFYSDMKWDTNADFFTIQYSIGAFQWKLKLGQFGRLVDPTQWSYPPTQVNAYYAPEYNQIMLLAGLLRSYYVHSEGPPSIMFGALGMFIANEIAHALDDQGQQYDENGNRVKWWSDASIAAFKTRAQCFVDQYNNYEQQGVKMNGELTLSENIADNGAIHTAYHAYKNSNSNRTLPFGLSDQKLFFLSFAQLWCSLFTTDHLKASVTYDPYSPGPIRILGSIQNSEEFSDAFVCPKPANLCELW